MASRPSSPLDSWTPHQVDQARRWVRTWQAAGPRLEAIRRRELRQLDAFQAITLLLGDWDYKASPRAPRPTSGLIEQQRLFAKLARR